MKDAEIIKILENEVECIKRQDGPRCPRFIGNTCAVCDLVTDTSKILEAYQDAIDALKTRIKERERLMAEIENAEAEKEALDESHLLDERDAYIAGRWET